MPETAEERRARQATIEQAARARLHGVEMPKRLDFNAKKLHHEYLCFKTLAKKVLNCYEGLEDSVKVNKVLMWMGPEACVKHEQHAFAPGDNEKLEPLWTFFDNLCSKKEGFHGSWNAARMTLKFMRQVKGESVDVFYGRIRDVLHQCEYDPEMAKSLEAETLKYGLTNAKIIEKVYALPKDADANRVLDTARAEEQAQTHIREVEKIRRDHNLGETKSAEELKGQKKPSRKKPKDPSDGRTKSQYNCTRCGRKHGPKQCPAYGKECSKCKRKGHFAEQCRSKKKPSKEKPKFGPKKKFHETTADSESSEADFTEYDTDEVTVQVDSVEVKTDETKFTKTHFAKKLPKHVTKVYLDEDQSPDVLYATVELELPNGSTKKLKGKVDTGAQVNLMNYTTFRDIFGDDADSILHNSHVKLTGYGGKRFKNHGKFRLDCVRHNDVVGRRVEFFVSDYGSNLFSLKFTRAMNIIKVMCEEKDCKDCHGPYDVSEVRDSTEEEKEESAEDTPKYSLKVKNPIEIKNTAQVIKDADEVFEGIGKLKGYQYQIEIDDKVPPVVSPRYSVPPPMQEPLKKNLDWMVEIDVIKKQQEATAWVSNVLCTPKPNGDIRICLNPKPLNQAVRRPHHFAPTMEDVLLKINGCKYFSTLDQSSGYWNIEVHPDSVHLLTFNTPFGRYAYKRLPFGLVSSQDVFQRAVDETFGDIPDVYCIADDILVAARTREEHDVAVNRVIQRCRDSGFRLNPKKARILLDQINFFGHTLTKEGLKPDAKKIQGIKRLAVPSNKQELQSLLGMFNYLGKFVPNLAAKTQDLRALVKKNAEFVWEETHTKIFESLKAELKDNMTLQYFDPQKEIVIECDASQKGLGACLLQDGKPVNFSSRSLIDAESRYSNLEREMLAVAWAVNHYRQYVYGRRFKIVSDHSPLQQIIKKDIRAVTTRLQRLLLRCQGYDFTIEYKKGVEMHISDCLSRCVPPPAPNQGPVFPETNQIGIFEVTAANESDIQKIRSAQKNDPVFQELESLCQQGWPGHRNQVPELAVAYWDYRHDIAVIDGIIVKSHRIVVPQKMRECLLQKLHRVHQGIDKSIQRARDKWFWPGMTEQIRRLILTCPSCLEHQPRQKQAAVIPVITTNAMQILGCDIFHHAGRWYSCIVDYHTGYPWVQQIKNQEADTVIQHFQSVCNQFGYPMEIVSDRGSQYTSTDFQELCLKFNIIQKPGTPHSQWKNGRCENAIGRLKRLLEKSKEEETTMEDILVNIRDTPLDANTPSPYELMFHRKVKSDLPSIPLSLFDSTNSINAGHRSVKHAERTNESESRGEPPRLEQHQTVMFMKKPQEKKARWSSGTVVTVDGQRSYTVEDDKTGTQYSRDRVHIKPIPGNATTPPTVKGDSKGREESVSVPVGMPNTKDTASPPKPKAETPMKQKADNPSESIKTSRPRRVIKAPVRYGFE